MTDQTILQAYFELTFWQRILVLLGKKPRVNITLYHSYRHSETEPLMVTGVNVQYYLDGRWAPAFSYNPIKQG